MIHYNLILFGLGLDKIKEAFILSGKQFGVTTSNLIDNIKAIFGYASNNGNYSGESMWQVIKESFNISYIDYNTFINLGLIAFFIVISILILMKWLGPFWLQLTGQDKKEKQGGLKGVFEILSVFLTKISKYIISFVIVIFLTILLTFVSKKIIDNGEYGINDLALTVTDNQPLLFNHFYGNITQILFENDKYLLSNGEKIYGLPYFNSNLYVSKNYNDNTVFNAFSNNGTLSLLKGDLECKNKICAPYNIGVQLALDNGFNITTIHKIQQNNSSATGFEINGLNGIYLGENNSLLYPSDDSDKKLTKIRKNLDNTGGFIINIKIDKGQSNIGNKETIKLLQNNKRVGKILSEVTNNKTLVLTKGKISYVLVTFLLENTNILNTKDFKINLANSNFRDKQLTFIFKYQNSEDGEKNILNTVYICQTDGKDILDNNFLGKSCYSFSKEEYEGFQRTPIILNNGKIIINDFGSILGILTLLNNKSWDNSEKYTNFIKEQIMNNNIGDLGIETYPLQFSYRYRFNAQTVNPGEEIFNLSLGGRKYKTNLKYKYTPSFIAGLTYLEKISGKSALKILEGNTDFDELKNYYNKYFLFAEGKSIKDLYISNNKNTLNSYLNLNPDQVIKLVGAESTGNGNVYKIGMVSTDNSITPLDIGLTGKDPLFTYTITFNNNKLNDQTLYPEQIDFLMKGMLSGAIYHYYKLITSDNNVKEIWKNNEIDNKYHDSYLKTNYIYSLLDNYYGLIYKSWIIGIIKTIIYFAGLLIGVFAFLFVTFKAVLSIKGSGIKNKLGETGQKVAGIVESTSGNKLFQILLVVIGFGSFYVLYEWALIFFVLASIIGIFLISRESKGKIEKTDEDDVEELRKIKQSLNSKNKIDKIKGALLVFKGKSKQFIKDSLMKITGNVEKGKAFGRRFGELLIRLSASIYAFLLISLVVYLVITKLMVYFNGGQYLTFNKWFGLFPDFMVIIFLLVWLAAIFSFQNKLSNLISGFIINQVTGQESFFNNFLQTYLQSSTFNKVAMGKNDITEAVVKNMKVGLSKIEEQTENERLKSMIQNAKQLKKTLGEQFEKSLKDKEGKGVLVSDLIERAHLQSIVEVGKQLKTTISNSKILKTVKNKAIGMKQGIISALSLRGVKFEKLTDEEIESLLLNNLLDEEKRKGLFELLKSKGLTDKEIGKFVNDLETKLKDGFKVKIKAIPDILESFVEDAKKGINDRYFYNIDQKISSGLDEIAKNLGINVDSEKYILLKQLSELLFNKGINIGKISDLLEVFGDQEHFIKTLPLINKLFTGELTVKEFKEQISQLFNELNIPENKRKKIIKYIMNLYNTLFKNEVSILSKLNKKFFELSGRKGLLESSILDNLYLSFQKVNASTLQNEKEGIIENLKKSLDKKYPNGIPPEVLGLLDKLEKINDFSKFANLLDYMYVNNIIDDDIYKDISSSKIYQYNKNLNNLIDALEKGNSEKLNKEVNNFIQFLEQLDPEKNKKIILRLKKLQENLNGLNLQEINDFNKDVKYLTLDSIITSKNGIFSLIKRSTLPENKKEELTNLVQTKLNNFFPSIREFYEGKISKDELLGKLNTTIEILENEFRKHNIKGIKIGLEFNNLVDNLEKIKKDYLNQLPERKQLFESELKQFTALLFDSNDLLEDAAGGIIEEIAGHQEYEDILTGLVKKDKEILGLKINDLDTLNLDLYGNMGYSLIQNGDKIFEENINKINKLLKNKDISEEEKDKLMKKKIALVDLYKELKEEKDKIKDSIEEWKMLSLKKKKLELKIRNTKDELLREKIKQEIEKQEKEIEKIKENLKVSLEKANNVFANEDFYDKDEIMKIKEILNENKVKEISKNINVIEEFKRLDLLDDSEFKKSIDNLLHYGIQGDDAKFLSELIKIKDNFIDKKREKEFIETILKSSSLLIHNKALSHFLNNPNLQKLFELEPKLQKRILDEFENGNEILLELIDRGGIKYFLENRSEDILKDLNIINKVDKKDQILKKIKENLNISDKQFEGYIKPNLETNSEEATKIKKFILSKLSEKVKNTEDKEKQKELMKLFSDVKLIFDFNKEEFFRKIENFKEIDKKLYETEKKQQEIDNTINKLFNELKETKERYNELAKQVKENNNEDGKEKLQELLQQFNQSKKIIQEKQKEKKEILNEKVKLEKSVKEIDKELERFISKTVKVSASNLGSDLLKKSNKNPLLESNNLINKGDKILGKDRHLKTKVSDNLEN